MTTTSPLASTLALGPFAQALVDAMERILAEAESDPGTRSNALAALGRIRYMAQLAKDSASLQGIRDVSVDDLGTGSCRELVYMASCILEAAAIDTDDFVSAQRALTQIRTLARRVLSAHQGA